MVNKVIKSNACKELTKKNGISIRNSTSSAKSLKSNINLKSMFPMILHLLWMCQLSSRTLRKFLSGRMNHSNAPILSVD